MTQSTAIGSAAVAPSPISRAQSAYRYLRRNPTLLVGLLMLLVMVLLWGFGALVTEPEDARPLSYKPRQPPSGEHLLGTDRLGKDILADMPYHSNICSLACCGNSLVGSLPAGKCLQITADDCLARYGNLLSSRHQIHIDAANDNDTPGTAVQEVMKSHVATRTLTDPTGWGTLTLR